MTVVGIQDSQERGSANLEFPHPVLPNHQRLWQGFCSSWQTCIVHNCTAHFCSGHPLVRRTSHGIYGDSFRAIYFPLHHRNSVETLTTKNAFLPCARRFICLPFRLSQRRKGIPDRYLHNSSPRICIGLDPLQRASDFLQARGTTKARMRNGSFRASILGSFTRF